MKRKNEVFELYQYWLSLKLSQEPLTKVCAKRIKDKIKELGEETVKEAIKNYALVLSDRNCICDRFGLCSFVTYRIQDFVYLSNAYNLYSTYKKPKLDEDGFLI
jgi:uncharacterized protein YjaZ